ncbi:MAG: MiaB/RimO family radical SAM methylthiotransferase [Chloroflexi bacterium]|nr:MiaB/RimO family radical SAM methylthiotransferase [Chloroflexota bacterium]
MKHYHIWTIGCQMNEADSGRVAAELDALGYAATDSPKNADVIVLNTCVVRQSAEDRAVGHLWSLKPLKDRDPERVIALMGCLVGIKPNPALAARFPFVDVFMPPSEPGPLIGYLTGHTVEAEARSLEEDETEARHQFQDYGSPEAAAMGLVDDIRFQISDFRSEPPTPVERPQSPISNLQSPILQSIRHLSLSGVAPIAANVPIVYGCSHACAFCVIPLRRGVEHSRSMAEIVAEARGLVDQGVREITLLGQIVDRYGKDPSTGSGRTSPAERPDLADLLAAVHEVDGLWRIRFLTSHPNYMTDRILRAVAELPKVCEQIEVPVQAGDDDVLAAMKRGYTADDYRRLVNHIREVIPNTAVHTDIIVGFPGETAEQFQCTYDLLAELRLDKAHLAMYSPRPDTVSARRMADDVPPEEKKRRWDALDQLQAQVVGEINRRLLGETVEVLVEDLHKRNRWRGRTRTNKLVFFAPPADGGGDYRGRLAHVRITWTGPWSMIGEVVRAA